MKVGVRGSRGVHGCWTSLRIPGHFAWYGCGDEASLCARGYLHGTPHDKKGSKTREGVSETTVEHHTSAPSYKVAVRFSGSRNPHFITTRSLESESGRLTPNVTKGQVQSLEHPALVKVGRGGALGRLQRDLGVVLGLWGLGLAGDAPPYNY